jgi:uncharacterized membrane protein
VTTPTGRTSNEATLAIEVLVARLLQVGTYVAMGLVLIGVVGTQLAGIDPLALDVPPPFDLKAIPAQMLALEPIGFLWAGLVLVLCLPIGRVVVAGVGFLAAHDRRLALVSLAVLLVVLGSIISATVLQA